MINKQQIRAILLALFVPLLLNSSSYLLTDEILKPGASELINKIGNELSKKTGINAYVLATKESFPVGFNLVEYSKKYEQKMNKPYVLFIFAPHAKITKNSTTTGRVGIIPSSNELRKLYDYEDVRDAGIDIISVKDSNTKEDKHNVGIVQAFSELADNIANSKNVEMTTTIPNDTLYLIWVLKILVYSGSIVILWIFLIRPKLQRGKHE